MKKILIFMTISMALLMVAGPVMALPFNNNRPWNGILASPSLEPKLQTILNDTFGLGVLDVVNSQSSAAIWQPAEAAVDAYLIKMITGASGNLGIYSYSLGTEYNFVLGSDNAVSFSFNNAGDLYVDGALAVSGFGNTFGFFWNQSNVLKSYTEDSKNGAQGYGPANNILALAYLVPHGSQAKLPLYQGGTTVNLFNNNDWVLAFEDYAYPWGDYDFNDVVFLVEDINPIPEPATMLLLGSGLIGLAGYARRRFKK